MIEQTPEGWWVVQGDTHLGPWVKMSKRLDHDEYGIPAILPHIKRGSLVIDVGANIGSHTVAYLRAVGPNGVVIAYEPHPDCFECLIRNCPTAICHDFAVGEKKGSGRLIEDVNVGASHLSDIGTPVQIVTLDDDVLSDKRVWKQLSLIKIDCEGCEPEVLRGAENLIREFRPTLFIEINNGALNRRGHTHQEIQDFLHKNLYSHFFLPPSANWHAPQSDIICIPA